MPRLRGIKVSLSRDSVQWNQLGYAVQEEGRKNYWAPCVVYDGRKFYLYYSNTPVEAPETQNEWLRVAVSTKPEGPFHYEKTLFRKFSVDAEVMKDKASNYYLFYSTLDVTDSVLENTGSSILVDRLQYLDEVAGEPQAVVRPTLEEEMLDWASIEEAQDWSIVEGATYVEHHGKAYLLYSANIYASENYYIGYALAEKDAPVHQLKWEKYPNNYTCYALVKSSPHVEETGHTSLVKAPNNVDSWLFYHGQDTGRMWAPWEEHRMLRMDWLFFDSDALMTYAPSASEQPAPELPDLQEFFEETRLEIKSGQFSISDEGWLTARTPFIALYEKQYQYYHLELDLTAKPANLSSKDGAVIAYRHKKHYTSVYLQNGISVLTVEQAKNGIHSILATFPLKNFDSTVNQHLKVVRSFADYELCLNGVYIGRVLLDDRPARVGVCSGYITTVFHYFAVTTETIDFFGDQMRLTGNFFASDVPFLINSSDQLASFRKAPVTLTTALKKDYQYSLTYFLPNEESRVTCRLQVGTEDIEIQLEPTQIIIPKLQLQHSFPLAKNDKSTATFLVVDQTVTLLFKNKVFQLPLTPEQDAIPCQFVLKKATLDSWELMRVVT